MAVKKVGGGSGGYTSKSKPVGFMQSTKRPKPLPNVKVGSKPKAKVLPYKGAGATLKKLERKTMKTYKRGLKQAQKRAGL